MESLTLRLDDGDSYDRILHGSLAQGSGMAVTVKTAATQGEMPAVLVSFDAHRDGEDIPVQAVTTARLFVQAAHAILAKYPDLLE